MSPASALPLLAVPWLLGEILVFRRDLQPGGGARQDRGSRVALILAIAAGVLAAMIEAQRPTLALPGSRWLWLGAGAALMLAGIALRLRAVRQLGEYFRTEVTLLDTHRLVTSGLYGRLRHPAYTGTLLTCFGFGLASGSVLGLGALLLLGGAAFAWRIRVEERALAARFGAEWAAHASRTRALIPAIW